MGVFTLALKSSWHWAELASAGRMRLNYSRIGRTYRPEGGGTYEVFRQTDSDDGWVGDPAVLVVGFRPKLLDDSERAHWLFERANIITTPFWSGFRGFRVKLWMVDRHANNYLDIYKWVDPIDARDYATYIQRVLESFSVPGSVWHKIYLTNLEAYMQQIAIRNL